MYQYTKERLLHHRIEEKLLVIRRDALWPKSGFDES
jgi:hypothetical protein